MDLHTFFLILSAIVWGAFTAVVALSLFRLLKEIIEGDEDET